MKMEIHDFYCLQCGNKAMPLARPRGKRRESFHRKKLFCAFCGLDTNMIECKDSEEAKIFKSNFLNGIYKEEAIESKQFCGVMY